MKSIKSLLKALLEARGYTIQRTPPLASEAPFALAVDVDYVLAHYLASREDARPFSFLQVGANDGVTSDRLHDYVRAGNWHGILIEPQSQPFARLAESYAGLDRLTLVNAAISDRRGSRALYVIQDSAGNPVESLSGLSSFNEDRLRDFVRTDGHHYPGIQIGAVDVACKTFEDVLEGVDHLDLLHIDAEGYDLELLKLFDFGQLTPAIVRFEHVHLSRADWDEAVALLAHRGYRLLREEYDTTAYSPE